MLKALLHRPLTGLTIVVAGAGAIAITALLSGSDKLLTPLDSLEIPERPEIPEEEIVPEEEPTLQQDNQDEEQEPNSEGGDEEGQEGEEGGESDEPAEPAPSPEASDPGESSQQDDSSKDTSSPAANESENEEDLMKVIRQNIEDLNNNDWVSTSHQLGSAYSIITRVQNLNNALDKLKSLQQQGS